MCDTCGCAVNHHHDHKHGHHHHGDGHDHDHDHDHAHEHEHHHEHNEGSVDLGRASLLSLNQRLADQNRGLFARKKCTVVNLVSSPGSGKTALLERTLRDLENELKMAVIVGDLATENDANRLRSTRAPAVQITTGTACHLDAHMILHALDELALDGLDLLFIENVGNLVCPASFDLGEDAFVVLHATTEGEDKPLKYPVIFQKADAVVISKLDLAPAVDFNRETARRNIAASAPNAAILETSSRKGDGLSAWYDYLRSLVKTKKGSRK